MGNPTLDDLYDDNLDDLVEETREDEYGETEFLYNGEWLDEDGLVFVLMGEDEVLIASARGVYDDVEDDLHFPLEFYIDENDPDFDDDRDIDGDDEEDENW